MTSNRPFQLLRFALEQRDVPLATALAQALGAGGDKLLRDMPRLANLRSDGRLLSAALELVAKPATF